MILSVVIDYILLDTARFFGELDAFIDCINELADNYTLGDAKKGIIEQRRVGQIVFKVRPIFAERTNRCEIRIERLG